MFELDMGERLAASLAGDYRQSGDEIMADAVEWKQSHPDEWLEIETRVRDLVRQGRRFSLRVVIDNLAWEKGFKCRHALTAPFARILAQRVPGFTDCCQMNKSKVDE